MNFLAMAPWQAWLLLGTTATAVTVIFFLRLQHRRHVISSAMIWERVLERRRKRSLVEWLRKALSLLIALMIGTGMALALGEPERGGDIGPRNITLVIDTSTSMATRTSDGRTRFDHAVDRALSIIEAASAADSFAVASTVAPHGTALTRDREVTRQALARMAPAVGLVSMPPIDAVAETIVITDGVALRGIPATATTISVFKPAINLGIIAFDVRSLPADPLRYQGFLEIGNFSVSARDVEIILQGTDGARLLRQVTIKSMETYRARLNLSSFAPGEVRARLKTAVDDLALDDVAYAYIPVHRPHRVMLVTASNPMLVDLLSSAPGVELEQISPEAYAAAVQADQLQEVDLVVLDEFAPPAQPEVAALVIGTPSASWLPVRGRVVEVSEAIVTEPRHPLLNGISFEDLAITQATRVQRRPEDSVLYGAVDTPLVVLNDSRTPWVLFTFALSDSDLGQSIGFPMLINNVLEWIRNDPDATTYSVGSIDLPIRATRVARSSGEALTFHNVGESTSFLADRPGLYFVTTGRVRRPLAVNVSSRLVSAVNRSGLADAEPLDDDGLERSGLLWRSLLFGVVSLLGLEAFTYHRRITL